MYWRAGGYRAANMFTHASALISSVHPSPTDLIANVQLSACEAVGATEKDEPERNVTSGLQGLQTLGAL